MQEPAYLFSERQLREYLAIALRNLMEEIDSLPSARVTGASLDELSEYLVARYRVTTPVLDEARIGVEQQHAKVDISNDPSRIAFHLNPGSPTYVDGTVYKHYVPFSGIPM